MVYKIFDQKAGSGRSVNKQIAEELHKPVLKKSKVGKLQARFKDNISVADLPEIESLSYKNEIVKYLLCIVYT